MKVLVTGGLGFIGSNLIRLIRRERPAWRMVNVDLVTYAANPANLAGIADDPGTSIAYRFVRGDVADRPFVEALFRDERFDAVIHCAAETHVDRSIHDSGQFLRTNVEGTLVLLEAAASQGNVRHLQMSTDEVYGTLRPDDPSFTELTPMAPRSPYSASKAAGDLLVNAFHHTHGLHTMITRCSNNYGPYQHPEKLIPLMITSAIGGRALPVYGDGRQRRDWIHVEDHCSGVLAALERGHTGETYNLGGGAERENIDVVHQVIDATGADRSLMQFVTDRPGHDRRYSVSFDKAQTQLGWQPSRSFEKGLLETIDWYHAHAEWWSASALESYAASRERIQSWEARTGSTRDEVPSAPVDERAR